MVRKKVRTRKPFFFIFATLGRILRVFRDQSEDPYE